MTQDKYVPPAFEAASFHCPHCGVSAQQLWFGVLLDKTNHQRRAIKREDFLFDFCTHCGKYSVWHRGQMIFPDGGNAPLPHPEMPDDVKGDFDEARGIVAKSPKGAAALLRLALQKLMPHLGEKGKNLDSDIASLVKKGLPATLQQALDTVRVIGNEAVHPGQIELNDSPEIAQALFKIVNMIVEKMIAEPQAIAALYGALPTTKLEAIEKRDGE